MKDVLFNIDAKDIVLSKSDTKITLHNAIWGNLLNEYTTTQYLNIIVDEESAKSINFDAEAPIVCCKATYGAVNQNFTIRVLVKKADAGEYEVKLEGEALAFVEATKLSATIKGCQLPLINIEGRLAVQFYARGAYVFSADCSDCASGASDNQETQLLGLTEKTTLFRYPMIGVGLNSYLHSIPSHTSLGQVLTDQCEIDSKYVDTAEFDTTTGAFTVNILETETTNDTTGLTEVSELDSTINNVQITRQTDSERLLIDIEEYAILDGDENVITCINS